MQIWAHTLVRNEERYIWFAVMSVINHVDKILIWDTGSDDATVKIIKEIKKLYPKKVKFKEIGVVDPKGFTKVSQQMLDESKCDWVILLDGDEVWWEETIIKVTDEIKTQGNNLETIVQPYYNIVGDIYHCQDESAGKYKFDNRVGHLTIRALNRNISGLHYEKEHGQRGLFDSAGKLIQERSAKRRVFLNYPYMHFTNMPRSASREKDTVVPKRAFKLKYELGRKLPLDFYYPEVFFKSRPKIVPNPWQKMDTACYLRSLTLTIPRKLKRRLIQGGSGY